MDTDGFDRLSRVVAGGSVSRRGIAALVASGAVRAAWPEQMVTAKKKKKGRCLKTDKTCDPAGGKSCCAGPNMCCPPELKPGETGGRYSCAEMPNDAGASVCCTPAQGGGDCEGDQPLCCPPSDRFPGFCELAGGDCCTDDPAGGSCPPGTHCCIDPKSVPQATCCANTAAAGTPARELRVPRNYQRRRGH